MTNVETHASRGLPHVPEVDWLKGFAILCVVCIHSRFQEGTVVHEYVVNRAVPIFLVLFGVTSDLWWRAGEQTVRFTRDELVRYYRGRLLRLLVPFWAMATVWAIAVVSAGRARSLHFGVPQAVATFFGFAPWIGPSYFVTVVLQLLVVVPPILFLYQRVGAATVLLAALAVTVVSEGLFGQVIAAGQFVFRGLVHDVGWFYFLVFSPRFLWAVVGGIFISRRWDARPPPRVVALAVAVTAVGFGAVAAVPRNTYGGALEQQMVAYAVDVPLALALLGLFRYLAPLRAFTAFLGWCGRWSWGIYLGHILVLEVVFLLGAAPQNGSNLVRGIYWLALFVAGGTLALGADAASRVTARLVSSLAGARQR